MRNGVKKYSNNEALITTSINYELLITTQIQLQDFNYALINASDIAAKI